MPIFIGGQHINKPGKDEPDPVVVQRIEELEPSLEVKREKVTTSPPKAKTTESAPLIDYKKSSFISDMLQSDKD